MSSRLNFFHRQLVTESELDLAFELLEQADRDLVSDIGLHGIISGAVPVQHTPVADLTIDLTAPGRSYDHLGQRIFFGTEQRVDCAIDTNGIPTEVATAGNERWLGIFLKFDRLLSDPRTDGNSQQVFFRQDESFLIIVRQGAEDLIGAADKVPLVEDELLVCDVRRTAGQTQIFDPEIDMSRRQAFVFAESGSIGVESALWSALQPSVDTVQAALDSTDSILDGHLSGSADRHPAGDIDYAPHGNIEATNVQGAINEVVDDLASTSESAPGSGLIGGAGVPATPLSLPVGHLHLQLASLLNYLNNHLANTSGAHAASAISAAVHNNISATNVQAQLQEIVSDYLSKDEFHGATLIGNGDMAGTPYQVDGDNLRNQLVALLGYLNAHTESGDHDERYYTEGEADARYYQVGNQVGDADTVDGQDASAFADAGHLHDGRYLREVFFETSSFDPGGDEDLVTLDEYPHVVSFNAALSTAPSEYFVHHPLLENIRVSIVRSGNIGNYQFTVRVQNTSTTQSFNVAVGVYQYSD